jgi:hypothetical protein
VSSQSDRIDFRSNGDNPAEAGPNNLTIPPGVKKVMVSADLYNAGQHHSVLVGSVTGAVSDIQTGIFTIWPAS